MAVCISAANCSVQATFDDILTKHVLWVNYGHDFDNIYFENRPLKIGYKTSFAEICSNLYFGLKYEIK